MAIQYQPQTIQTSYRSTTILSPQTLNFETYRERIENYFNDFTIHYGILDLGNPVKVFQDFVENNQPHKHHVKLFLNTHALIAKIITELQTFRFEKTVPRELIAEEIWGGQSLELLGNDLHDMVLIIIDAVTEQLSFLFEYFHTTDRFHIVKWLDDYTPLLSTGIEIDYSIPDPFTKVFTWFEEK